MSDSSISPITLIGKKEQELAKQIQAARREAEATISRARQRASSIREENERAGLREAEEYYRREIAAVEQLGSRIGASGREKAGMMREVGPQRLARALQAIMEFVLPG